MNTKSHYKMFKAGKLWMTALISAAVLGVAQVSHADTVNDSTNDQDSNVQSNSSSENQQALQQSAIELSKQGQDQAATAESLASEQVVQPTAETGSASETDQNTTASQRRSTDPQSTMTRANSTITVANPSNYPTQAAQLVGRNAQGQPYYIYQIVNLLERTSPSVTPLRINDNAARLILSVDPTDSQGTNYLYVTDDKYSKVYQTIVVPSGQYRDISVSSTGAPLTNPAATRVFRVSVTAPYSLNFNGTTLSLPASVSIKTYSAGGSTYRVQPVYGLGNQASTGYNDKVDISPENTAPAIEYIYRDQDGNFTTNVNFPANVPVNGITGQQFTVTNVDNYKQVINGYYLTNRFGSIANSADGSYKGTISQFQIGKSYQKTLYNWNRTISQRLIYTLINPDGTMEISQVKGNNTETRVVPAGSYKLFSDGTYARNPFVPGANSVQLVYADLGHIIPVDENGNVISTNQPIYNNDASDPHQAAPTAAPDLTAEGWVLVNPNDAMIDPVDPGADTKVVYTRVVTDTQTVNVSQTVKYEYADGITTGRPALPADNVQTVTFTHTVVTNPVTGQVLQDTWTPAQQFTAVTTPTINGFWADQAVAGGNTNVTQDTPSTVFVVQYFGPDVSTDTKTVTQTVHYKYADGITSGRPALPADNVQTLTFTATIERNPQTGEVISTTWSPAQNFSMVTTPELADPNPDNPTGIFYYDLAEAGSTSPITHDSADLEYTVVYAAPTITQRDKPITQTIHYEYADGNTQDRPALPVDNVQTLTFAETLATNPFTGHVVSLGWEPSHGNFTVVDSPEIAGFYYDNAQAGSSATVVPEDQDTYYVVKYAAPITEQVDQKTVTQTITYAYADGITDGRPALPQTDVQELVFNRTQVRNPFTNEVISDNWTPAQNFTVVTTPTIAGFYYDLAQAGSDAPVTHESNNTEYQVLYLAPNELTETKHVTQTIKYVYADGVTAGRPALPATNVQTLTFTRTNRVNPNNPNEVTLGQWTPVSDQFTIVQTPAINGFYYDLAQAGSDAAVTGDSANTEYVVQYAPARTITDTKTVKQTIKYVYADGITEGRPTLPADNVQALTFTHTIVMNPYTDEVISDTWTPAQSFETVDSPAITGFTPNIASVAGQTINHLSADLNHVVEYSQVPVPDEPTPDQPEPEEPTPEQPAPDQGATAPESPDQGTQQPTPAMPTKPTTANRTTDKTQTQELPQTGQKSSTALVALGLVAGMFGLGLGKRKHD